MPTEEQRAAWRDRKKRHRRDRLALGVCANCPKANLRPIYKNHLCVAHYAQKAANNAIQQRPLSSSTIDDLDGPRVQVRTRWSEWDGEQELPEHLLHTIDRLGCFPVDMEYMGPRIPGGLE